MIRLIARWVLLFALLAVPPLVTAPAESATPPPPARVGLPGWWPDQADGRVKLTRLDLPDVSLVTWVEDANDAPPMQRLQQAIAHTAETFDHPALLDAEPQVMDAMFTVADPPKQSRVRLTGVMHPDGRLRCIAIVNRGDTFALSPHIEPRLIRQAFGYLGLQLGAEPERQPSRMPMSGLAEAVPAAHRPNMVLAYTLEGPFGIQLNKAVPVFRDARQAVTSKSHLDPSLFGPTDGPVLEPLQIEFREYAMMGNDHAFHRPEATTDQAVSWRVEPNDGFNHAPPDFEPFERGQSLRFGPITDADEVPDPLTLGWKQAAFTPDGRFALGHLQLANLPLRALILGHDLLSVSGEYHVDGHVITMRLDGDDLVPDGHVVYAFCGWRPGEGQSEFNDKAKVYIGSRLYTASDKQRPKPTRDDD